MPNMKRQVIRIRIVVRDLTLLTVTDLSPGTARCGKRRKTTRPSR